MSGFRGASPEEEFREARRLVLSLLRAAGHEKDDGAMGHARLASCASAWLVPPFEALYCSCVYSGTPH